MRRMAIVTSIITVLLLILGFADWATNYNWAQGDQDPLFGNPKILLNDGATVLVAAGLLAVGSGIMWYFALRKDRGDQEQP